MYKELIEQSLAEAKAARSELTKEDGIIVGRLNKPDQGLYLSNYANCLLNRQLDIFDDSIFLLENDRTQSACALSRGMIETHAFARLLNKKIEKILINQSGIDSVDKAIDTVLKFTNSSRFKKTEQEKIQKSVFDPNDYMFTEEAKYRFENLLAVSQYVMSALRELYTDELEQTKHAESQFEMVYDLLSEHVHPSQTSIFHYYTPETHLIPTSVGNVHAYDAAKLQCARALHFIVDAKNLHYWSSQLADEMTRRGKEKG
ncbi:DUF5677 domain-containing protein [Xenorhabdus bovienii]|uniref:Uncharacterized protein n=1 Tax=Xenorhabdus bovienii str. kraussei Becker Underwood TaxID=1398204 RepID=A0A077PWF2_XENBV|nr:DUF5677 domain-containing protein [Xenorhabdus bovienii]CDH24179.1 conserved hypothetical protein [Xenorhabdus bovienii str. kraussei Becker Underwood]